MTFRLRPTPLPDESAAGYLLRLFEINGAQWRAFEFESRGLKIKDIVHGDADDALRAFRIDPSPFIATTAHVGAAATVDIAGERLDRDDWLTGVRRWCPKCFEDDVSNEALPGRFPGWRAHRRFWWDAACVSTCPVHAVRLERACPTCGLTAGWYGGHLTACRKGHSLISCDAVAVAREHTRADAYVVGRLGGGPRLPIATLDALPLHQAVDVMKRFGSAAIGGAHGGLHNMDPSRHPEAMTAGLTIAGGWPKSFEHLLDSLAARSSGEAGAWGANEVYGELVRWARRIKATAFGRQIFDRIHAHHAQRVAVPRDSAAAAFIDEDSPVHITWIAEACGGSTTTMAQYLAALKIEPVQTASGLMAYARSDALRVVAIFKDSIGIDEVAAALDIHPTQAADLVEKGVVNSQPVHDEVDASHRRFSRAGIEALIERIAADAPVVDSALQELKPLCTRGAAIGTGGISAMIEAVLAGKARVRARLASHRGLRSLLVDPAEFRRARRLADDDRLLFKDVPKILGLHPETAWAALRVGLLVEIETNSFGVVVQRASVEQFAKKYTTAAKMAGPSKRNQRAVQRRLAEAGVRPVFSKAIHPRCKTLVYRITDIPEKILTEFPGGGFPSSAPAAATPKASASREKNTRNPETRPRRSANRPTPQSFPKTTEIDNGH